VADEDDLPPVEGDAEWREQTQQTNELAKKLAPPHDDDAAERSP
jgi:hypothetical protein